MYRPGIVIYSVVIFYSFLHLGEANAQVRSLDIMGGLTYNFSSPLIVLQEGREDFVVNADYETLAFEDIPYFVLRLNYKISKLLFEFQYIHHKINMTNTGGEIQHFEISDGFNILSIHYRLMTKYVDFRFGAGIAITYCKSTIRGYDYSPRGGIFNTGYNIAGPVLIFGVNKEFALSKHFYLNAETQFTSALAMVTVAGGYGYVSNFALHLMLGVGYKF